MRGAPAYSGAHPLPTLRGALRPGSKARGGGRCCAAPRGGGRGPRCRGGPGRALPASRGRGDPCRQPGAAVCNCFRCCGREGEMVRSEGWGRLALSGGAREAWARLGGGGENLQSSVSGGRLTKAAPGRRAPPLFHTAPTKPCRDMQTRGQGLWAALPRSSGRCCCAAGRDVSSPAFRGCIPLRSLIYRHAAAGRMPRAAHRLPDVILLQVPGRRLLLLSPKHGVSAHLPAARVLSFPGCCWQPSRPNST